MLVISAIMLFAGLGALGLVLFNVFDKEKRFDWMVNPVLIVMNVYYGFVNLREESYGWAVFAFALSAFLLVVEVLKRRE